MIEKASPRGEAGERATAMARLMRCPMNENHNKKLTAVSKVLRKNMTNEERHLWYDFLKKLPCTV
ncbi:MAG: hypothetical protein J6L00_04115, partial [Clostridia bacterium]|nr:hypothetical protein [Clostridia bacterium]